MQSSGGLAIVVLSLATLTLLWPVFEVIALTIYVVIRTLISMIASVVFAPFIIIWRKVRALWASKLNCSPHNNRVPRRKHNHCSSGDRSPRKDAPEFAEDSDYEQERATIINSSSKHSPTSRRAPRKSYRY
jgi:hypothetical protein